VWVIAPASKAFVDAVNEAHALRELCEEELMQHWIHEHDEDKSDESNLLLMATVSDEKCRKDMGASPVSKTSKRRLSDVVGISTKTTLDKFGVACFAFALWLPFLLYRITGVLKPNDAEPPIGVGVTMQHLLMHVKMHFLSNKCTRVLCRMPCFRDFQTFANLIRIMTIGGDSGLKVLDMMISKGSKGKVLDPGTRIFLNGSSKFVANKCLKQEGLLSAPFLLPPPRNVYGR
jgi:hypothetical protein